MNSNRYLYEKDPNTGETYAVENPQWVKRAKRQSYKLLLEWSGIPRNYWDLDFRDYKGEISKPSVEIAQAFAKNITSDKLKNANLYMWGPTQVKKQ